MIDDAKRWRIVRARDPHPQQAFVYAVRTTGVYCRPGCASRMPRRANVVFFDTPAAAEAAGFRPCKRCRPHDASAAARHLQAVEKACRFIEAADTAPPLARIAAAVGVSRFHLHRLFRQVVGVTPHQYARAWRSGRLARRLAAGEPVSSAAFAAGYGSGARAYADAEGMTPGARRRGGRGERIAYTLVESALGWVLLAATGRGVCAVELGDDPAGLELALRARFPRAHLVEDRDRLREWARQLVEHIAAPHAEPALPLDIRGTAFQASVWRALRRIPLGQTATYTQIAAAVGRPTAVRAVANACAANPLAVLVPCHRVVRADGGLGGYRWGRERKRALLRREHDRETAAREDND